MVEELSMTMRFECDNCGKAGKGESQNKFIMEKNMPSRPVTVCSPCAKLVDAHNEQFLAPIEKKEEAERLQRRKEREREDAKLKEAERAKELQAAAPLNALIEQNAQMLQLLTQLVVNQAAPAKLIQPGVHDIQQALSDDQPRAKQRKPRQK